MSIQHFFWHIRTSNFNQFTKSKNKSHWLFLCHSLFSISFFHFAALYSKNRSIFPLHMVWMYSRGPLEKHDVRVQFIPLKNIGSVSHLQCPCGRKIIMKSLDIWSGRKQTASACVSVCPGTCISALFMHNMYFSINTRLWWHQRNYAEMFLRCVCICSVSKCSFQSS